jgi:hypothetical protein
VFGVAILIASLVAVTDPSRVYPHESGDVEEHENAETQTVEYYLPYPGVLPDSPMYKLKAVRDWIWLKVTLDEREKVERELLFADKRINAAVFLIEGGKEALGVTTATKAEKYLESAINRAAKLVAEEKDVKSELGILITASAKHLEILDWVKSRATGERVQVIETVWTATKVAHEKAEQALLESK